MIQFDRADYEETLDGELFTRFAPGARHELVCARLHAAVTACMAGFAGAQLLAARSALTLARQNVVSPDLALVTAATGKLWLAAEIIAAGDHHADTVIKKDIYEGIRLPRLWMIDTRYDNVEIYHASEHGLILQGILAGRETLTEPLLPGLSVKVAELFAPA
jgi:hypothetical protein